MRFPVTYKTMEYAIGCRSERRGEYIGDGKRGKLFLSGTVKVDLTQEEGERHHCNMDEDT